MMNDNAKLTTPLYPFDLGHYSRKVATTSSQCQIWFDRGLIWCYAFNHEEAASCFLQAAKYDPHCAMAHWGLAYAIGPNYNKTWSRYDEQDRKQTIKKAQDALEKASAVVDNESLVEKALISALSKRFPKTTEDVAEAGIFDTAYADAMMDVYTKHRTDLEIHTLYPEALMCIRPRQLWNLDTGEATTQDTLTAKQALEEGFALPGGSSHPGLNHLYIHLMEMSSEAYTALPAADRLRDLVPDGSHLQHMSTHIDIAVGDYRHAVESNRKAMLSDNAYFARQSGGTLYWAYRTHNIHVLTYAAMLSGRYEVAISSAKHLLSLLTPELLAVQSPPMVDWVEFHGGILAHTYVRFGRWDELLRLELPKDQRQWSITTAILRYGRAIALGVLGRTSEARAEREAFEKARRAVPRERRWGVTSTAKEVLAVASLMCEGELEYREGNHDRAFTLLRQGVVLEDGLPYTDPPLWMQPVRHALGALLVEQGRLDEAEQVYKQDLGLSEKLPARRARLNNVWSLQGLHECLTLNGKAQDANAIKLARDVAMASSDVPVAASCFCRLTASTRPADDVCCTNPLDVGSLVQDL
jgi:tetratricopeptide (TPR) repeat protein